MSNQIVKSTKKLNVESKIKEIQSIIQKTILSAQKYKLYDILGANELNICISTLNNIFDETNIILTEIEQKTCSEEIISSKITDMEHDLVKKKKNFGTESLKDLIYLIFGNDYINERFKHKSWQ